MTTAGTRVEIGKMSPAQHRGQEPRMARTKRISNLHDPIPKMRVFPVAIQHADGTTSLAWTSSRHVQGATVFESQEDARK